jgi:hypothetical protein
LLLNALPSRLMPAVRVTGSDTVVRPLGRAAPFRARAATSWSCYRARRPLALLERRSQQGAQTPRETQGVSAPDVLPAGQICIGGKARRSKGG